ncbi:MAG: hypothetical protein WBD22_09675 [Pyrinomonadaceae bacterium]
MNTRVNVHNYFNESARSFGAFIAAIMLILLTISGADGAETKNVVLQGGVQANAAVSVLIHNQIPVTVRFKVKRDGSDNTYAQRRVRFSLISPSGVVDNVIRSIGSGVEAFELDLPKSGGGNDVRQWRVELRNFETTSQPEVNQPVRGTAEFVTTGSHSATISAPSKFGIVQSDSATKNISMPFTGTFKLQANWDTDEITLENYQLKFELYKGSTKLHSDTGYSRDSVIIGISSSQRMKLTYQVKASDFQISGDWKVKVYGSTRGKVKNVDLKMSISDGLFE